MQPRTRKMLALAALAVFIGIPLMVFFFDGDGRGFERACRDRCHPRFARLVADPTPAAPAGRKRWLPKCECY